MSLINRVLTAPKQFRANSIVGFINDCSDIYRLAGKNESGFLLNLDKVQECSMIGVLLVYKIIEFSIKQDCFDGPMYVMSPEFMKSMEKYGFTKLIIAYLADKDVTEKEFVNLQVSVTDSFIIAPQALLRNDKYSAQTLNDKYLPKIEDYYKFNPKTVSMIFTCFSEILLNFWEHAVDDTQSVIVAYGNKSTIEIGCADNGKGIMTTLNSSGKRLKDGLSTFLSAVKKGVTSKEMSNHMGYGLWIIDEIAKKSGGKLHLYSEGYFYQREANKKKYGKCGHWQGTIVYLSLPVNNPIKLIDIETPIVNNIKINWL